MRRFWVEPIYPPVRLTINAQAQVLSSDGKVAQRWVVLRTAQQDGLAILQQLMESRKDRSADDIHPPNVFSNEVSDIQCGYECNEGASRAPRTAPKEARARLVGAANPVARARALDVREAHLRARPLSV